MFLREEHERDAHFGVIFSFLPAYVADSIARAITREQRASCCVSHAKIIIFSPPYFGAQAL